MSFQTDGGTFAIAAVQSALGALIGTFGLVKQFELNQRQIVIAEHADVRAEEYLALTQDAYNTITLPTFALDKTLFNRFVNGFANYQALYETEAFREIEYTPDYVLQEGRAISAVQRQFDKAYLQRKRQNGQYNTGRARYEAVWFSTMAALARVDASNHAYRFEEAKKRYYDTFFWRKQSDGVHVVDQMEKDAINALAHAQAGAASGLNAIGHAEGNLLKAAENAEATLAVRGDIWGGLANGAFRSAGSAGASMMGSPMGKGSDPTWGDTTVSKEPANFVPFGFGSASPGS